MVQLALAMVAAYVLGSINVSILALRLLGGPDPRTRFSGNAGTTNVYRLKGPVAAAVVLILDMGRAIGLALGALWLLPPEQVTWVGLALILGNRWPWAHGFRGGKGVANLLGFCAALSPWTAAAACLVWVTLYGVARRSFVGSFGMVLTLAAGTIWTRGYGVLGVSGIALAAGIVLAAHHKNLREALRRPAPKDGES